MAQVAQQAQKRSYWEVHPFQLMLIGGFFAGEWVTRSFGWFYMMVSRFAGPIMTVAVGYLIVYAIDSHHGLATMPAHPGMWDDIASFSSGIINVTPELVFPGTVVLSIQSFVRKNWLNGVLQAVASIAFAILTIVLLNAFMNGGINDSFLSGMLLWRAISSLFYTVVAEICSHHTAAHNERIISQQIEDRLMALVPGLLPAIQYGVKSEVDTFKNVMSESLKQEPLKFALSSQQQQILNLTETLKSLEIEFKSQIVKSQDDFKNAVELEVKNITTPLIEMVQGHSEKLSTLPELVACLNALPEQIERLARSGHTDTSSSSPKTTSTQSAKPSLRGRAKHNQPARKGKEGKPNMSQFIADCLKTDCDMSSAEIKSRGLKHGLNISDALISIGRKNFKVNDLNTGLNLKGQTLNQEDDLKDGPATGEIEKISFAN